MTTSGGCCRAGPRPRRPWRALPPAMAVALQQRAQQVAVLRRGRRRSTRASCGRARGFAGACRGGGSARPRRQRSPGRWAFRCSRRPRRRGCAAGRRPWRGGHGDDRHGPGEFNMASEGRGHGIAVHAGQLDVEQDELRSPLEGRGDAPGPGGAEHGAAAVLQQEAHQVAVLLVVLDHQHPAASWPASFACGQPHGEHAALPQRLATSIEPPIRLSSRRQMANPRPGPFVPARAGCCPSGGRAGTGFPAVLGDADAGVVRRCANAPAVGRAVQGAPSPVR
jgi:hypothetical protein